MEWSRISEEEEEEVKNKTKLKHPPEVLPRCGDCKVMRGSGAAEKPDNGSDYDNNVLLVSSSLAAWLAGWLVGSGINVLAWGANFNILLGQVLLCLVRHGGGWLDGKEAAEIIIEFHNTREAIAISHLEHYFWLSSEEGHVF